MLLSHSLDLMRNDASNLVRIVGFFNTNIPSMARVMLSRSLSSDPDIVLLPPSLISNVTLPMRVKRSSKAKLETHSCIHLKKASLVTVRGLVHR